MDVIEDRTFETFACTRRWGGTEILLLQAWRSPDGFWRWEVGYYSGSDQLPVGRTYTPLVHAHGMAATESLAQRQAQARSRAEVDGREWTAPTWAMEGEWS